MSLWHSGNCAIDSKASVADIVASWDVIRFDSEEAMVEMRRPGGNGNCKLVRSMVYSSSCIIYSP